MRTGDTGFLIPDSDRVEIYRASVWWRIVFEILALLGAGLGGLFIAMPYLEGRSSELSFVILCLIVGAGFILCFIYLLFGRLKVRIEIYPDRIESVRRWWL